MLALISRILTIGLALYSYLSLRGNFAGNVAGGPSAAAAKLLFAIQILMSIVFFLIPSFPESIHFGTRRLSDYTPQQLQRIAPLLRDMLALMGLFFALYFTVNIQLLAHQARALSPREAARAIVAVEPWLVGGLLIGQGAIVFYYLRRFDAAISSETPPSDTIED